MVWKYRRSNGKCPAEDFLSECGKFRKKFEGSFDAVTKMGRKYHNHERFRALDGAGKPLWEFKEFDHRLYCYRQCFGDRVRIILLDGWVKEKKGRHKSEDIQIERAKRLLEEFLEEEQR